MSISETEALDKLVSFKIINNEIAEILKTYSRLNVQEKPIFTGATSNAIIVLMDKSASMSPLKDAMIESQKSFINTLLGSNEEYDIHFGQILFNDKVQDNYYQNIIPLRNPVDRNVLNSKVKFLDEDSYQPEGGTALYDTICYSFSMIAPIMSSAEELGTQVFIRVVIITDGIDEHSKIDSEDLKKVIDMALEKGLIQQIVLVGLGEIDFKALGNQIGIDDIITTKASPSEVRKTLNLLSNHIIRDMK